MGCVGFFAFASLFHREVRLFCSSGCPRRLSAFDAITSGCDPPEHEADDGEEHEGLEHFGTWKDEAGPTSIPCLLKFLGQVSLAQVLPRNHLGSRPRLALKYAR